VFECARGVVFDRELQQGNIAHLARRCVEGEFELNHRRLFVKVFADALFRQMVDGEQDLSTLEEEDIVLRAVEDLARRADCVG
jgi:hypothetical protein